MFDFLIEYGWMIFVAIILLSWAGSAVTKGTYRKQTSGRVKTIQELKGSGHSWEDIPLILKKMGYYNKEGNQLTVDELREEYADIIANEKMGVNDE
ncbi:MAG: hypothetical protein OXL96_28380 [Candidatus Poribacteria bacterium]|nr:hypothetical protein [Candidatus Poribacteria bacterium]